MQIKSLFYIYCMIFCFASLSAAETALNDYNQDGSVSLIGFGDSLTFGVGDNYQKGQDVSSVEAATGLKGYTGRLSQYLGIAVSNNGLPGEVFIDGGDQRSLGVLFQIPGDVFIFMEGSNDAIFRNDAGKYQNRLQRLINQVGRTNKRLLLNTIPLPCCNHAGQEAFVGSYNNAVRLLAASNQILLADLDLAFQRACNNPLECDLLNLPEGLHPNKEGYDLIAQVIAAKLLNIDIFIEGGNTQVEQALGLPSGSIPSLN
jgi:lysophospholipase L1-like esterase